MEYMSRHKQYTYHDMRSNSHTVSSKSWVKLQGPSSSKCLHGTVQRSRVWVFAIRARLHLLYLCLHIIEGQTARWCKEPRNSTCTYFTTSSQTFSIQSATTKNPIKNLVAYFIKSSIVLTTASCQTECHKHASMLYKMLHYKTTFCLQTSFIL